MATSNIASFTNLFIFLYLISGVCSELIFYFENQCSYTIWLAANPGIGDYNSERPPGTTEIFKMPDQWSGSIWARTACSNDESYKFTCESGDCGSGIIDCQGAPPKYPITLLNFNIDKSVVSYEVSLIHGHNVKARIHPDGGTLVGGSNPCPETDCSGDISNVCPFSLVSANKAQQYVACYNPCDKLGQCGLNQYTQAFKNLCPQAHTYVGDNNPPLYQCSGATSYTVTFCPL